MIPIRAERRVKTHPWAVWTVALACVAALVRLAWLPDERAAAIVQALGVVPARLIDSPASPGQWLTLLTSAFLHAGWVHLVGNVLFLMVFGPAVHERLGWHRFLVLYLGSGIAGALAHTLAEHTSTLPLVGASGAIAGVLGAHLVFEPKGKITTIIPVFVFVEVASLPAAFVIGLWFVLQLASAVAPIAAGAASDVAWFAHIGGFAAGIILAAAQRGNSPTRTKGTRGKPKKPPIGMNRRAA